MTDSHQVLTGVNSQRVIKYSVKGHFAASSWFQQASSWLQKSLVVFRQHLEVVCFPDQTAEIQRRNKPVPKFIPHLTLFTSDPGLHRWWKKGSTSAVMAKRIPSEKSPLKKIKASILIPQGTTLRSSTNARGDINTKFRPNTIKLQTETSRIVIIPELDINFVNNLKRIALTTSHYLCLRRPDKKNLFLLTNPCLLSLSSTPSKNVEEMNEDDLHRIVESENNCTSSQEDPKSYEVGGYMPISERDILGDKYEVCRKLGYGQFSTVWLCQNRITSDYVAIKVSKSQSKLSALAKDEIKLLECTNSTNRDHAGFRNIVQMFDYFCCQSINGNHTAIVLEVMGPSLLHLIKQSEYRGIQIPGVRRIIKQILQGLEYLHDECGIIHTDLKPENILIKAKEPYIRQMVNTAKKFNELGITLPKTYVTSDRWNNLQSYGKDDDSYEEVQLFRTKSYPEDPFLSELVSFRKKHSEPKLKGPMWIDANIEVKIGDMGNATWVNNKYNSTIQTRQYRALEVILDAGYDCPADIWSVGCLAFELATGEFLFYPKLYNNFSLDVDHITLIWEVLGGIPKYITKRGSKADEFFSNGKLRHIEEKQLRIWKIEDVLVDKYKWKRLDAIPFAGFIEYLIEPDPSLRYTASAALSSEWINE